jgi:hypothetical protein
MSIVSTDHASDDVYETARQHFDTSTFVAERVPAETDQPGSGDNLSTVLARLSSAVAIIGA